MKDGVQEQLIALRRNQILDAAAAVFAEKGFQLTTIKDIAKEAGIAEGTIYNYFVNKSALLLGIFERMKSVVQQEIDFAQLATMDMRSLLKTLLLQPLTALSADNFALFRVVMSEVMVNKELNALYFVNILEPTLALAESQLASWAATQGSSLIKMQLTVRALSSMVLGLMVQRIMGDKILETHWDELPDVLVDLLMKGLDGDQA